MLCFLPKHCARGGTRRLCPCERGSVHVCSVTCFLQHCARGIEPASVVLTGLWNATVSCPSNARGVAHVECGPASVGVYCVAFSRSHALQNASRSMPYKSSRHFCTLSQILFLKRRAQKKVHAIFAPRHAFCCVISPASLLLLPACCHLLSSPATSAAAACLAKTRPEVARVWRSSWGGFCAISSLPVWSLFGARIRLVYTWQKSQLV